MRCDNLTAKSLNLLRLHGLSERSRMKQALTSRGSTVPFTSTIAMPTKKPRTAVVPGIGSLGSAWDAQ